MATAQETPDDSGNVRRERVYEFARIFGIDSADIDGGRILPKDDPTDDDLERIREVSGGTIDPAKVVALVYDRDEWGIIPDGLYEDTIHPATSAEETDYEVPAIEFENDEGAMVLLTEEYVTGISTLIGIDLQSNPHHVLMNDKDEFPVIVEDTQSDGIIMLAPRIAPSDY